MDDPSLSRIEKLSLLQRTVYKGEPFSDKLADQPFSFPKSPFTSVHDKSNTCNCQVFRATGERVLQPISHIRSNGEIYGRYGSGSDDEQTRKNLKIWWAYGLEGPARYQQLWGDTNGCVNAPYSWGWNRGLESAERDIEAEDIEPTYIASIDWTMLCLSGSGTLRNCGCEKEIAFEYQYHSVARAQATTESGGGPFCGSNRNARASAVDFAQVAFGELRDPSSFRLLASMANGESVECSQTWNAPSFREFTDFTYELYVLIQGVDGDLSQEARREWQREQLDRVQDAAEPVFDEPWMERTTCGGSVVGNENHIREGNYYHDLEPNKPIRLTLASGGHLSVAGLRRWNANARIHSSFRLASALHGGPAFDHGPHCCYPYSGAYMLSTISGDTPVGPSRYGWQRATEGFLASRGVDTDISGSKEYGEKIHSTPRRCRNQVVIKRGSNSDDPKRDVKDDIRTAKNPLFDYPNDTKIISYTVYDVTGRVVLPSYSASDRPISTLSSHSTITTGVYLIDAVYGDGTHRTHKLFVP